MHSLWSLDKDGKTLYQSSKNFREALASFLRKKNRVMTEADYEKNPAWPYLQAHQNGYNQAIDEILKLIEDKEK